MSGMVIDPPQVTSLEKTLSLHLYFGAALSSLAPTAKQILPFSSAEHLLPVASRWQQSATEVRAERPKPSGWTVWAGTLAAVPGLCRAPVSRKCPAGQPGRLFPGRQAAQVHSRGPQEQGSSFKCQERGVSSPPLRVQLCVTGRYACYRIYISKELCTGQLMSQKTAFENPDFFRLRDFIQFTSSDLPLSWSQSV